MAQEAPDELRGDGSTPRVGPAEQGGSQVPGRLTVIDLPEDFFPVETRVVKARDALMLAALPALALVAWSCPDRLCLTLCRAATRLLDRMRPGRYGDFKRIFADYLPDDAQSNKLAALAIDAAALHHLERIQLLRYHRPGSWRPQIEVAGKDNLARALAEGKGAILWVTYTTFSDMISKIGLREQGYDVWHLSRHTHGHFSSTRFGIRFLNPIRISLECRYLADRVVIDPADPRAAMARLQELLADNQVVSITLGAEARRVTLAPFGPEHLPLAGGAPSLALKSGAALLPVFTERRADGSFLVTIEPPLEAPPGLGREDQVAQLIAGNSALLYRYFARLPAQYHCGHLHSTRQRYEAVTKGAQKAS
ncbi:MAG: hypothetical protein ACFCUQ_06905 [Kiloniellales bacterium]